MAHRLDQPHFATHQASNNVTESIIDPLDVSYNVLSHISSNNSNSEWVLFDPSSSAGAEDVLSTSSNTNEGTEVYRSESGEREESNVVVSRRNLVLRMSNLNKSMSAQRLVHDAEEEHTRLFQEVLLTKTENSSTSLKNRINEWQQEQFDNVFEKNRRRSFLGNPNTNDDFFIESYGIDDNHHLYSKSILQMDKASSSNNKRFYGDFLLKTLSEREIIKVKKRVREFSKYLNDDSVQIDELDANTLKNTHKNPLIRCLLQSTLINSGSGTEKKDDIGFFDNLEKSRESSFTISRRNSELSNDDEFNTPFWTNIHSSRLSGSSFSSILIASEVI